MDFDLNNYRIAMPMARNFDFESEETSWIAFINQYDDEDKIITNNITDDVLVLAPRPNGKCYCGHLRKDCSNFQVYGFDCNKFGKNEHELYIYTKESFAYRDLTEALESSLERGYNFD